MRRRRRMWRRGSKRRRWGMRRLGGLKRKESKLAEEWEYEE